MKKLSIIVPIYNEAVVLDKLVEAIGSVCVALEDAYELEILLVDDGSTDSSWQRITELVAQDNRYKGVRLTRNFGQQAALSCGYEWATGDATITLDADLQDPPEIIPEMVREWEQGAKVVMGVRNDREGETPAKLLTARLFYWLIGTLSEVEMKPESADFRLMDAQAVKALVALPERQRFVRGLVQWLGFTPVYVKYDRPPRAAGKTHYQFRKMLRLAFDGITAMSSFPLRIAYFLALGISVPFLMYLLYNLTLHFCCGMPLVKGWASLLMATIIFGTSNLIVIAFLGEYIGRIFTEVKNRPVYVVSEVRARERRSNSDGM